MRTLIRAATIVLAGWPTTLLAKAGHPPPDNGIDWGATLLWIGLGLFAAGLLTVAPAIPKISRAVGGGPLNSPFEFLGWAGMVFLGTALMAGGLVVVAIGHFSF